MLFYSVYHCIWWVQWGVSGVVCVALCTSSPHWTLINGTSCPLTWLLFCRPIVQIPNNAVYPPSPLCVEKVNGIHGVLGCSQILEWFGKWLLQVWVVVFLIIGYMHYCIRWILWGVEWWSLCGLYTSSPHLYNTCSSTSYPLTWLLFVYRSIQIPNNGVYPHSPLCDWNCEWDSYML